MNTYRACGCKGMRTCLSCEIKYNINKTNSFNQLQELKAWSYCVECQLLYDGWDSIAINVDHPSHSSSTATLNPPDGIVVQPNFLSESEGEDVMRQLDKLSWDLSQSGRRKQNFGPKTNFKKRKLQNGDFKGFPKFTRFIQGRFNEVLVLEDFQSIEQCTLEYEPDKGSSIDAHIDDCWIWGERVVTVNCLGDSVLTLTLYEEQLLQLNEVSESKNNGQNIAKRKYNLDCVSQYQEQLRSPLAHKAELKHFKQCVLRIPMPKLSLIVLYGPVRYQFEHSVLREDIKERRVCIAYREFTPMYIDGDDQDKGKVVTTNANKFLDCV